MSRSGASKALIGTTIFSLASLAFGDPIRAVENDSAGCQALEGVLVPQFAIGLPTSGAQVLSATIVEAINTGANAADKYCKLKLAIRPVDRNAPDILVQLNLPTAWNGKALMFGGGGYNGTIRDPAGNVPAGAADRQTPLARGYATFHSDSGHQAGGKYVGLYSTLDGTFGMNDEALRNFSGDFIKKTRDAAVFVIAAHYGRKPLKTYFAGGSTGGREVLAGIQKWPEDFDGAIALYPAWNAASLNLQFGRISKALAAPGAFPNSKKLKMLHASVLATCDELDGVKDGLISNPAACKFDPATVRCPGGRDTGDTCLSDPQIAAMNTYNSAINFNYPLGSKETSYPGFNVYAGVDAAGTAPVTSLLALNTEAPASPPTFNMPFMAQFWDMWVRYFVARNASLNALELDPESPGKYQQRISELTALQDINKTDLSTYYKKGGKLLIAHGTADPLVSTRASQDYYLRLNQTMGARQVNDFVRYYEIPGFGHVIGTDWTAAWDSLTALENWVEAGEAPRDQVVADTNAATKGRTRPLCEFPSWPRYNGSGDVNSASSFACFRSNAERVAHSALGKSPASQ